ncbi:hypothetical protein BGW38_000338 [Lunasporangiospora selenospora]|uniref:Uncharacterized protein n=1 Tax=Lunasporangiospora selenospora TaxID=979761 RepID=A0A9P6G2K4_9FUNG|nr:hypothetical protein BGW38_000338 [Lunasporangiospora selenospora]
MAHRKQSSVHEIQSINEFQEQIHIHDRVVIEYYDKLDPGNPLVDANYTRMAESADFTDITFLRVNTAKHPEIKKEARVHRFVPSYQVYYQGQRGRPVKGIKPPNITILVRAAQQGVVEFED